MNDIDQASTQQRDESKVGPLDGSNHIATAPGVNKDLSLSKSPYLKFISAANRLRISKQSPVHFPSASFCVNGMCCGDGTIRHIVFKTLN